MKKKNIKLITKRPDEMDIVLHKLKEASMGYPQSIHPTSGQIFKRNKCNDKN